MVNTKITTLEITRALVRMLDRPDLMYLPNYYFGNWECDLFAVTESNYAVEYEIKISKSDWEKDRLKDKWKEGLLPLRAYISRFYYVIPDYLLSKAPAWLTPEHGLIVCSRDWNGNVWASVYKEPIVVSSTKQKLEARHTRSFLLKCWYRHRATMLNKYDIWNYMPKKTYTTNFSWSY